MNGTAERVAPEVFTAEEKQRSPDEAGGGRRRWWRRGLSRIQGYRVGQTVALVLLWVCMGLYGGLVSLTLPELRDRMRTTVESMSLATGSKRIGSMVGALIGGALHDRFYTRSNLFLAISLMVAGTCVMVEPHTRYVAALGVAICLKGIAQGTIDAVGNAFVMRLWGEKADPAMHAIHFGYSLGTVFTPLMTAPFLAPDEEIIDCSPGNATMTSACVTMETSTSGGFADGSRIEIPYFIAGGLTVVMSTVFWAFFIIGPPRDFKLEEGPRRTWKEVFNPGSCARGHVWYGVVLVLLLILWTIASNGVQSAYGFGVTFATDPDGELGLTKQEGAWYDFTRNTCGMVGRLLGIIISPLLPIQGLLMFEVVIICGSSLVVAFVGTSNKMVFWVFSGLTSLMTSPAHPGLYAFIDKYIILFSLVVALSMIGSGLMGFLLTWANGFIYDRVDKKGIFYLSAGAGVLLLVTQIIMQIVASIYGPRHRKVAPQDEEGQGQVKEGMRNGSAVELTKEEAV